MSTASERTPRQPQPSRYDIASLKADLAGIELLDELNPGKMASFVAGSQAK